jgi:membrane fusion protein (multidrug efflux system)
LSEEHKTTGGKTIRLMTQIAVVMVLAGIVALGWWMFSEDGNASRGKGAHKIGKATLVLVESVKFADDKVVLRAVGTGEAIKSASIHPAVSGEVIEVSFKAGERVKKGDVLVRLDSKHQRLAVDLAELAVKEAARQVKRLQRLAPSGAASVARLQTTETEYESARLRLEQARASLRDRTVYAPFDGVVGLTDIERGDRVSEQTMVTTLDDRSAILVDFNLPEEFATRLRVGEPVALRPWMRREVVLEGSVSALGSRIDPATRTLRIKAAISNTQDEIRPGTSFDVQIAFMGRQYATIPEVGVLWSRDGAYLWRVTDNKVEKVFVSIVRRDKGRILVDGPLSAGDTIVVEGVQGLRPAQKVRTEPFAATMSPSSAPARKGG